MGFQRRFPTDEACGEYLVAVRWPRGFRCPSCGHDRGWRLERRLPTFECAGCDRQISVTAGTVMHRSHLPLTTWFWAAYLMATHSNGISALQLQGQLGIGSYKTAWLLARKLRRAMVDPERLPLAGLVEIDETSLPQRTKACPSGHTAAGRAAPQGQDAGRRGRGDRGPQAQSAASRHPRRLFGQEPARLHRRAVAPTPPSRPAPGGAIRGAPVAGHDPEPWAHGSPPRPALDASRLQQPQALGPGHLSRPPARAPPGRPLDEFVFRFNRRHDRHAAFHRLLGLASALPTPATRC